MDATPGFHFHLEWPAAGAVVSGPVVWLRGWLVGRDGNDFTDLRVRVGGQVHLGLLGFPRADLAAHFKSGRAWLPAAFVVGVPLPDGAVAMELEALDACGLWHPLPSLSLTVGPGGAASPQVEGQVVATRDGSWTGRGAHQPFAGELGEPVEIPKVPCARVNIFGWLVHRDQPVHAVLATTDLLIFNRLDHSLGDESPAARAAPPRAQGAWFRGGVDAPPSLPGLACLRVYAQLDDGTVQLCFATRFAPPTSTGPAPLPAVTWEPAVALGGPGLPALPSGRPRRLLVGVSKLQADEAAWRALEAGRYLVAGHEWAVRLVTAKDGPMRGEFEAAGIDVQVVDTAPLFAAGEPAAVVAVTEALGRQIWWGGLDAVAVFDAGCFWLVNAARRNGLPVLYDCPAEAGPDASAGASPALEAAMVAAWQSVSSVCHASPAGPRLHRDRLGGICGEVVPSWIGDRSAAERSPSNFVVAPIGGTEAQGAGVLLRAVDWLARRAETLPWRIAFTGVGREVAEALFVQDDIFHRPALVAVEPGAMAEAAACVSPAFSNHPVHALLEAAAGGVPIITTAAAVVSAHFGPHEALIVPAGNPQALAHALADLAANPSAAARRATRARIGVIRSGRSAAIRWRTTLETMAASQP